MRVSWFEFDVQPIPSPPRLCPTKLAHVERLPVAIVERRLRTGRRAATLLPVLDSSCTASRDATVIGISLFELIKQPVVPVVLSEKWKAYPSCCRCSGSTSPRISKTRLCIAGHLENTTPTPLRPPSFPTTPTGHRKPPVKTVCLMCNVRPHPHQSCSSTRRVLHS